MGDLKEKKSMQRRVYLFPLLILLLSFSLACGLDLPGLSSQTENTPTPLILDNRVDVSAEQDGTGATIMGQDTPTPLPTQVVSSAMATLPAVQAGSASTEEPPQNFKPAANQVFIMPGAEPTTPLDPHLSGDATGSEYMVEIFSGLMKYDRELKLVPDIAAGYQVSDDGLVYTFKLHQEASFHDGKPIRAEDFKWSFERACDPVTRSTTADTYLGDIVGCRDKLQGKTTEVKGVQALDDLTLQLTIDKPKGYFPAKLTYPTAYVLDRKNVESGGSDWYKTANGSGPFKLTEFSPQENVIILDRNENFYGRPKPTVERVVYLINAPINPMTGYEEGLVSLGADPGVTYDVMPIGPSLLSRATDPNNPLSQEFVSANDLSLSYVGFNIKKPPFDDPKIRQALSLALDKPRMVRLISEGSAPVATGIVPPGMPGYENPGVAIYEFDPERALALIAESKYGDISKLPDITLTVPGTGGQVGSLIESIVDSYQKNLGLEIAVEQVPWAEFLADLSKPEMPYQMYQLGWIADYPDPQDFLEILFHSNSTQNHGYYSNPQVDALLEQAAGVQDEAERVALYQQAEQLILDDAAVIPLSYGVENWLVKPYVKNFWIAPLSAPKLQYIGLAEH